MRFEFALLISVTPSTFKHDVNFTVITADYRAGFVMGLSILESSLSHRMGMHWQKGNDKRDFSYEIQGYRTKMLSFNDEIAGSLRVTIGSSTDVVIGFTDFIDEKVSFTRIYKKDRIAKTEVSLKHSIDLAFNSFTHTLKMEHPKFPRVCTKFISI